MTFEKALAFALRWEGGYSNHPNDKGGETNRGITYQTYNAYRRSKGLPIRSVRHLEESELQEIYRRNYWTAAGCDLLPPLLAIAHFDWAVNAGVRAATRTLQRTVGAAPDGIMGPLTRAAIKKALATQGEKRLVMSYCGDRGDCYRRYSKGSQAQFLAGWLNRLNALRRELGVS